jgi:transcriptional regulator with XRE-family HTH domain
LNDGKEHKKLRHEHYVTQRQLSGSTGIPEGTIGRWEAKEVNISTVKVISAIEGFFGKLAKKVGKQLRVMGK